MKAINPNEIKDNFIELIGKEWMLVSAGDKEKFNMMTASWGGKYTPIFRLDNFRVVTNVNRNY